MAKLRFRFNNYDLLVLPALQLLFALFFIIFQKNFIDLSRTSLLFAPLVYAPYLLPLFSIVTIWVKKSRLGNSIRVAGTLMALLILGVAQSGILSRFIENVYFTNHQEYFQEVVDFGAATSCYSLTHTCSEALALDPELQTRLGKENILILNNFRGRRAILFPSRGFTSFVYFNEDITLGTMINLNGFKLRCEERIQSNWYICDSFGT